jgi:hypothetical protein
MHNFNKPLKCTECESDQYHIFADLDGNGIKCLDCMHKHYVFKPKANEKKGAKRKRIKSNWEKMNKRSNY